MRTGGVRVTCALPVRSVEGVELQGEEVLCGAPLGCFSAGGLADGGRAGSAADEGAQVEPGKALAAKPPEPEACVKEVVLDGLAVVF